MILDRSGRRAGRGAYLCADGACWRTALAKGAISRALEAPLPADLRTELEAGATEPMIHEGGARGQE